MTYAVVFPGQGAAVPGAGEAWRDDPVWELVDRAESLLEEPVTRLLLEADREELGTTRASQLAVLLTSLLGWDKLAATMSRDRAAAGAPDPPPVAFAGHSLGQITALIAAGAVGRDDGLRLAAKRAELSQRSADTRGGRMAALMGATVATAEQACADVEAWVANDNAPGQVVVAGTPEGLAQVAERAKTLGVRRVMALDVGHAFHTPLLTDAAAGLRLLLDTLTFTEPVAPIVANTDALTHTDPGCWPDQLSRHLVEPVRWRASQETLATLGVDTLVEVGPGRVLANLAKRTLPEIRVLNLTTPSDVPEVARALSGDPSLLSSVSPSTPKDPAP